MNKLIFANLLHRPVRSIISVFAVAIEVIMMLTIIAIMMGQLDGPEANEQWHRRRSDCASQQRHGLQRD
jgi:putative ABC transport system permease protein